MSNRIIFFILLILLLTSFQSNRTKTPLEIPKEVKSAKQLIELANDAVNETNEKSYHVGQVRMKVNSDHEGEVQIIFADESDPVSPNVIEVKFDTLQNKYIGIEKLGENSKLDPGWLNIDKWNIDSNQAYEITEGFFKVNKEFESALIYSNYIRDVWIVNLYKNNKEYFAEIKPYNGNVIISGTREI